MTQQFNFPVRIYYEDTDAGGIVYYANYLKFFERARTEWLRELGVEQDVLLAEEVGFVVAHVEMKNKAAAKFNDLLVVRSQIKALKKASVIFYQQIYRGEALVAQAEIKVACVNIKSLTPIAIPEFVFKELQDAL